MEQVPADGSDGSGWDAAAPADSGWIDQDRRDDAPSVSLEEFWARLDRLR